MLDRAKRRRTRKAGFAGWPVQANLGWPLVALLFVALVFGGGGVGPGLANATVQLAALALLLLVPGSKKGKIYGRPKVLLALVAATFAVPLLQLVPLPPGVWQQLPGRTLAAESFALIEREDVWFPLSLDRLRTLAAVFALLGPLAVLHRFRGDTHDGVAAGLLVIVGLATTHFLFGALQYALDDLYLYGDTVEKRFFGFFASHNTSGLFLIVGLTALVGYDRMSKAGSGQRLGHLLLAILLVFAVILTRSRSSTTLLLVPLGFFALYALGDLRRASGRKRLIVLGSIAIIAAFVAGLAATNDRLGATWQRYADLEDSRPLIWEDTLYAIDRYWPVGGGVGTFDEVFQVDESLEYLAPPRVGRAHNDYLEVTLESGILGVAVLAAWFLYLAIEWWRRRASAYAPAVHAAGISLLCIAVQALVDFPLRNVALLTVAGLLIALLTAPGTIKRDRSFA